MHCAASDGLCIVQFVALLFLEMIQNFALYSNMEPFATSNMSVWEE